MNDDRLNAAEAAAETLGLMTSFSDLDRLTLGLTTGSLTVIASRPGIGPEGHASCES